MQREPSQNAYATIRGSGRRRSSFLAPIGAGLSAFSGHSWQRLPGRASLQGVSLMRLPLNQPLSTFLLVLSILVIVLGIAFVQSGTLTSIAKRQ